MVNVKLKNSLGKMAYYIQGLSELSKFKSFNLKVGIDGVNFEFEAFLFIVLNSGAVAGVKNVADFAKIDDGKLDLIAIKKCNLADVIKLIKTFFSDNGIDLNNENIFHQQSKRFTISTNEPLMSDIDGEMGSPLPIEIDTISNALDIFV